MEGIADTEDSRRLIGSLRRQLECCQPVRLRAFHRIFRREPAYGVKGDGEVPYRPAEIPRLLFFFAQAIRDIFSSSIEEKREKGMKAMELAKELLVDCVVKPLIGAAVSTVAMAAIGKGCDKMQRFLDDARHKEEKREKARPFGLLV